MTNNLKIIGSEEIIRKKIHTIRGMQIIIDNDLAHMYDVSVKALNQAVKRNIEIFPENFCFQLTQDEFNMLRSQFVTSSSESLRMKNRSLKIKKDLRFHFGTSKPERGGRRYLPYAFTEQGVSMLSSLLRSKTAVRVSIQIINTFVSMRRFILKNAGLFSRLDLVELRQLEFEIKTDKKFEQIFAAIENKSFQKKQGIFYDGQIFDAYTFVSELIRSAKESIVLIDNYVDDSVLTLFSKRNKNVHVTIYTKEINKQLSLDFAKYNSQYSGVEIKEFNQSHDRFMIIDEQYIYHFGASLKDSGKKWFAFSKFDKEAVEILRRLK